MIEDGIGSLGICKKLSKDDASNNDNAAVLAGKIYGTKQSNHLDKIICDHGLYTAFNLSHTLTFVITLPPANEIMERNLDKK